MTALKGPENADETTVRPWTPRRYGACLGDHPDNEVGHIDALFKRACECECHEERTDA